MEESKWKLSPTIDQVISDKVEKKVFELLLNLVVKSDGKSFDLKDMSKAVSEQVLIALSEIETDLQAEESTKPKGA
jgi:hypothetical protein